MDTVFYKMQALDVGETTIAQVRAAFGAPPEKMIQTHGGDTVLEYIHATGKLNGAAFIPMRAFDGKETAPNGVLRLTFDKAGLLKKAQQFPEV